MQALLEQLRNIVRDDGLTTDALECVYYAQDVYSQAEPAAAVVSPTNTQQLAAVVRAATGAGHAVIARGGGMSYAKGYVPLEENSILVDMSRMNRILEINPTPEVAEMKACKVLKGKICAGLANRITMIVAEK